MIFILYSINSIDMYNVQTFFEGARQEISLWTWCRMSDMCEMWHICTCIMYNVYMYNVYMYNVYMY